MAAYWGVGQGFILDENFNQIPNGPVIDYDARSEAPENKNLVSKQEFGDFVLEIRDTGQALSAAWSWAGQGPPTGTTALTTAGINTPRPLVHERDGTCRPRLVGAGPHVL